ncbi:MAG: hypothetical protein NXY57DRAFT_997268, partial [Lentinula lateritia]
MKKVVAVVAIALRYTSALLQMRCISYLTIGVYLLIVPHPVSWSSYSTSYGGYFRSIPLASITSPLSQLAGLQSTRAGFGDEWVHLGRPEQPLGVQMCIGCIGHPFAI